MNFYNLHHKPEKLHGHDKAFKLVPEIIWAKYSENRKELDKYKDILMKDPKTAYSYAAWKSHTRWPEAEKIIGKSKYAFDYWKNVINGKYSGERFPEGEDSIGQDLSDVIVYTKYTKHGIESVEQSLSRDISAAKAYTTIFPERKEAMEKYLK